MSNNIEWENCKKQNPSSCVCLFATSRTSQLDLSADDDDHSICPGMCAKNSKCFFQVESGVRHPSGPYMHP